MLDFHVAVATHKAYAIPTDPVYVPLHVGAVCSDTDLGIQRDDQGQNISADNPHYCELTALYWMWKNTAWEGCGLVHYRRYFAGRAGGPSSGVEMRDMLDRADVVLARKRHYVIQTVAQQYSNSHHGQDLEIARSAVASVSRTHLHAFDQIMRGRSLSLYNMFLMRRPLMDEYCDWLFDVLDRCRQDIPLALYGSQQRRVLGFLGERLLNVWVEATPNLRVLREPVYEAEPRSAVKAAVGMLGRMVGVGRAE